MRSDYFNRRRTPHDRRILARSLPWILYGVHTYRYAVQVVDGRNFVYFGHAWEKTENDFIWVFEYGKRGFASRVIFGTLHKIKRYINEHSFAFDSPVLRRLNYISSLHSHLDYFFALQLHRTMFSAKFLKLTLVATTGEPILSVTNTLIIYLHHIDLTAAALASAATTPPPQCDRFYVVKSGDTCNSICAQQRASRWGSHLRLFLTSFSD